MKEQRRRCQEVCEHSTTKGASLTLVGNLYARVILMIIEAISDYVRRDGA